MTEEKQLTTSVFYSSAIPNSPECKKLNRICAIIIESEQASFRLNIKVLISHNYQSGKFLVKWCWFLDDDIWQVLRFLCFLCFVILSLNLNFSWIHQFLEIKKDYSNIIIEFWKKIPPFKIFWFDFCLSFHVC